MLALQPSVCSQFAGPPLYAQLLPAAARHTSRRPFLQAAQPAAAQLSQQEDADGWNDGWNDDLDADDPSTLLAAIEAPLISLADSAHEPPAADSASAVHDGPHALLNHAVDDYLQPGVKLGKKAKHVGA